MRGILLILVTLIGLFFYSFRLKETLVFTDDTSRDTLKALLIWQNKTITLIGAPASLSLNTIREVYFGSLYLYIGILGLIIASWDPIGAVLPNTILFTLSIPLFYLFVSTQTKDKIQNFFATLLYVLSPITVIHSRFFWNPNLIIPFSVIFWYLIVQKTAKKREIILYSLSAGLIAGIMFNFHYLAVLPILSYLIILFITKRRSKSILALIGLLTASLPILIFELRNNFYLTQSILFNIFNQQSALQVNLNSTVFRFGHLVTIFGAILGLKPAEIDYPIILSQNLILSTLIILAPVCLAILNLNQIKKLIISCYYH